MSQRMAHFRQNIGHKARVGAAVFLTGAFLLTSGILNKAYSQDNRTKKGGDTVLLMQTNPSFKTPEAKKDTTITMDTIPKIVKPDVRTLEHYVPPPLTMPMFMDGDSKVELFKLAWIRMEDNYPPFGLPTKVIDSYSPRDRKELMERWETAKVELRVAFLSGKSGVSPENALKTHTKKEINALLREWQGYKDMDKLNDERMKKPASTAPIEVK